MAQIIDFPNGNLPPPALPLPELPPRRSGHWRLLQALRFLFNRVRRERPAPVRMFVIFEADDDEHTTSYLNLGFSREKLVQAVDSALQHSRAHPKNWDFD